MTKSDKVLVILFRYLLGIGSRISFAHCIRGQAMAKGPIGATGQRGVGS